MKFLGVLISFLLLIKKYGCSDVGWPLNIPVDPRRICTKLNTALLTDEHQTLPQTRVQCVYVSNFKSKVDGNANLDQYKAFFDASQTAETLESRSMNLTNVPVNVISRLPNLQDVNLSFNKIHNLPEDLSNYAPNIYSLTLSYNQVHVPDDGPLLVSNTLQSLQLNDNGINKLYVSTFEKLPNLRDLFLYSNNLQDLSPIYGKVPNLKYLDVADNYIDHLPSKSDISEALEDFVTEPQNVRFTESTPVA
uniref:Leucine-rich repeat-containing protein 59-like n=1 Tax=Diabrotica virgifera virgifera TaxID=50390 RepID=A0A6P7FSA8_DIAVI